MQYNIFIQLTKTSLHKIQASTHYTRTDIWTHSLLIFWGTLQLSLQQLSCKYTTLIKVVVIWVVTLSVKDGGNMDLWNSAILPQHYKMPHPRWSQLESSLLWKPQNLHTVPIFEHLQCYKEGSDIIFQFLQDQYIRMDWNKNVHNKMSIWHWYTSHRQKEFTKQAKFIIFFILKKVHKSNICTVIF